MRPLLLAVLLLAACAPRAPLVLAPDAPGRVHEILVATTRARVGPGPDFGAGRRAEPTYGRYAVAVPPSHLPGTVAWLDAAPDPATDFTVTNAALTDNRAAFCAGIAARLATRPRGQREVVVFVPGYNTNFAEGLYRFAQMVHDFETTGVPVLYSWPSAASAGDYLYDRDSVLFARDGLEALVDLVAEAPAEGITLVAHSLGAQLLMETLRSRALRSGGALWPELDDVALIAPDVDVDVFRAQVAPIGALPQPFVIFASARDRALRLSEWMSGSGRLGGIDDLAALSDLDVTVIDTSAAAARGANHLTPVASPWMISVLRGLQADGRFALGRPDPSAALPVRIVASGNALGLVIAPPGALAR